MISPSTSHHRIRLIFVVIICHVLLCYNSIHCMEQHKTINQNISNNKQPHHHQQQTIHNTPTQHVHEKNKNNENDNQKYEKVDFHNIYFGILSYSTSTNLGDEIQSVAAARAIQRSMYTLFKTNRNDNTIIHQKMSEFIPLSIDRDTSVISLLRPNSRLSFDSPSHLIVLYNGWYDSSRCRIWPPQSFHVNITLHPIIISQHIHECETLQHNDHQHNSNQSTIHSKSIQSMFSSSFYSFYNNYIEQYGIVYTRDHHTTYHMISQMGLTKNQVETGGCLTMTIAMEQWKNNTHHNNNRNRNGILIVDLNPNDLLLVPAHIRARAETITQLSNVTSFSPRYRLARSFLHRLSRASLVITSRLHSALPCLSFDTPVIFIYPNWKNDSRFGGLDQYLTILGRDKIVWENHKNKPNQPFRQQANNLQQIINRTIQTIIEQIQQKQANANESNLVDVEVPLVHGSSPSVSLLSSSSSSSSSLISSSSSSSSFLSSHVRPIVTPDVYSSLSSFQRVSLDTYIYYLHVMYPQQLHSDIRYQFIQTLRKQSTHQGWNKQQLQRFGFSEQQMDSAARQLCQDWAKSKIYMVTMHRQYLNVLS